MAEIQGQAGLKPQNPGRKANTISTERKRILFRGESKVLLLSNLENAKE